MATDVFGPSTETCHDGSSGAPGAYDSKSSEKKTMPVQAPPLGMPPGSPVQAKRRQKRASRDTRPDHKRDQRRRRVISAKRPSSSSTPPVWPCDTEQPPPTSPMAPVGGLPPPEPPAPPPMAALTVTCTTC